MEYACMIIKATAILHNFLLKRRIPEEDDDEEVLERAQQPQNN